MFERWIAGWLEETTRAYITNLPREKLRVDFRRGHLELENLELRAGVIHDGAFALSTGLIRRVVLDIPWSGMAKDPIKVSVDGVYVLLCPANEHKERVAEAGEPDPSRSASVQTHGSAALSSPVGPGPDGRTTGFSVATASPPGQAPSAQHQQAAGAGQSRLLQWITTNAQVCVTNVIVRFETSMGGAPGYGARAFGFSLSISELSYGLPGDAPDREWPKASVDRMRQAKFTRAIVAGMQLTHLTEEWLTSDASVFARDGAVVGGASTRGQDSGSKRAQASGDLLASLLTLASSQHERTNALLSLVSRWKSHHTPVDRQHAAAAHASGDHHIVGPFDIVGELVLPTRKGGKLEAKVRLPVLVVSVNKRKLHDLAAAVELPRAHAMLDKRQSLRPLASIRPVHDAAAWWRYAFNAAVLEIRELRAGRRALRRRARRQYMRALLDLVRLRAIGATLDAQPVTLADIDESIELADAITLLSLTQREALLSSALRSGHGRARPASTQTVGDPEELAVEPPAGQPEPASWLSWLGIRFGGKPVSDDEGADTFTSGALSSPGNGDGGSPTAVSDGFGTPTTPRSKRWAQDAVAWRWTSDDTAEAAPASAEEVRERPELAEEVDMSSGGLRCLASVGLLVVRLHVDDEATVAPALPSTYEVSLSVIEFSLTRKALPAVDAFVKLEVYSMSVIDQRRLPDGAVASGEDAEGSMRLGDASNAEADVPDEDVEEDEDDDGEDLDHLTRDRAAAMRSPKERRWSVAPPHTKRRSVRVTRAVRQLHLRRHTGRELLRIGGVGSSEAGIPTNPIFMLQTRTRIGEAQGRPLSNVHIAPGDAPADAKGNVSNPHARVVHVRCAEQMNLVVECETVRTLKSFAQFDCRYGSALLPRLPEPSSLPKDMQRKSDAKAGETDGISADAMQLDVRFAPVRIAITELAEAPLHDLPRTGGPASLTIGFEALEFRTGLTSSSKSRPPHHRSVHNGTRSHFEILRLQVELFHHHPSDVLRASSMSLFARLQQSAQRSSSLKRSGSIRSSGSGPQSPGSPSSSGFGASPDVHKMPAGRTFGTGIDGDTDVSCLSRQVVLDVRGLRGTNAALKPDAALACAITNLDSSWTNIKVPEVTLRLSAADLVSVARVLASVSPAEPLVHGAPPPRGRCEQLTDISVNNLFLHVNTDHAGSHLDVGPQALRGHPRQLRAREAVALVTARDCGILLHSPVLAPAATSMVLGSLEVTDLTRHPGSACAHLLKLHPLERRTRSIHESASSSHFPLHDTDASVEDVPQPVLTVHAYDAVRHDLSGDVALKHVVGAARTNTECGKIEAGWNLEGCQRLWQILFSALGAILGSEPVPWPRPLPSNPRPLSIATLLADGMTLSLHDEVRDRAFAVLTCLPSDRSVQELSLYMTRLSDNTKTVELFVPFASIKAPAVKTARTTRVSSPGSHPVLPDEDWWVALGPSDGIASTVTIRYRTYAPSDQQTPDMYADKQTRELEFYFGIEFGPASTTLVYRHEAIQLAWEVIYYGMLDPMLAAQTPYTGAGTSVYKYEVVLDEWVIVVPSGDPREAVDAIGHRTKGAVLPGLVLDGSTLIITNEYRRPIVLPAGASRMRVLAGTPRLSVLGQVALRLAQLVINVDWPDEYNKGPELGIAEMIVGVAPEEPVLMLCSPHLLPHVGSVCTQNFWVEGIDWMLDWNTMLPLPLNYTDTEVLLIVDHLNVRFADLPNPLATGSGEHGLTVAELHGEAFRLRTCLPREPWNVNRVEVDVQDASLFVRQAGGASGNQAMQGGAPLQRAGLPLLRRQSQGSLPSSFRGARSSALTVPSHSMYVRDTLHGSQSRLDTPTPRDLLVDHHNGAISPARHSSSAFHPPSFDGSKDDDHTSGSRLPLVRFEKDACHIAVQVDSAEVVLLLPQVGELVGWGRTMKAATPPVPFEDQTPTRRERPSEQHDFISSNAGEDASRTGPEDNQRALPVDLLVSTRQARPAAASDAPPSGLQGLSGMDVAEHRTSCVFTNMKLWMPLSQDGVVEEGLEGLCSTLSFSLSKWMPTKQKGDGGNISRTLVELEHRLTRLSIFTGEGGTVTKESSLRRFDFPAAAQSTLMIGSLSLLNSFSATVAASVMANDPATISGLSEEGQDFAPAHAIWYELKTVGVICLVMDAFVLSTLRHMVESVREKARILQRTEQAEEPLPAPDHVAGSAAVTQRMYASGQIEEVQIVLMSTANRPIPIALLSLSHAALDAKAPAGLSDNVDVDLSLPLHLDLYNQTVGKWEPMLEPVTLELLLSRDAHDNTGIHICTQRSGRMEVVLSDQMLQSATAAVNMFSTALTSSQDALRVERQKQPYLIRNQTGAPLSFWRADTRGFDRETSSTQQSSVREREPLPATMNGDVHLLERGEEMSFDFWAGDLTVGQSFDEWRERQPLQRGSNVGFTEWKPPQHAIGLRLEGENVEWASILPIPISSTGSYVIQLTQADSQKEPVPWWVLQFHATLEQGIGLATMVLTVSSPMMVCNHTMTPVTVSAVLPSKENRASELFRSSRAMLRRNATEVNSRRRMPSSEGGDDDQLQFMDLAARTGPLEALEDYRRRRSSFSAHLAAQREAVSLGELGPGESLMVPPHLLEGGIEFKPISEPVWHANEEDNARVLGSRETRSTEHWSGENSHHGEWQLATGAMWPGQLLSSPDTLTRVKQNKYESRVVKHFSLPESEYLIAHLGCRFTSSSGGHSMYPPMPGRLFVTPSYCCLYGKRIGGIGEMKEQISFKDIVKLDRTSVGPIGAGVTIATHHRTITLFAPLQLERLQSLLEQQVAVHAPRVLTESGINDRIRHLFGLQSDECVLFDFNCAYVRKRAFWRGKLYITNNFAAFHGNAFGKLIFPLTDIDHIEPARSKATMMNGIEVHAGGHPHLFVLLFGRDRALEAFRGVWRERQSENADLEGATSTAAGDLDVDSPSDDSEDEAMDTPSAVAYNKWGSMRSAGAQAMRWRWQTMHPGRPLAPPVARNASAASNLIHAGPELHAVAAVIRQHSRPRLLPSGNSRGGYRGAPPAASLAVVLTAQLQLENLLPLPLELVLYSSDEVDPVRNIARSSPESKQPFLSEAEPTESFIDGLSPQHGTGPLATSPSAQQLTFALRGEPNNRARPRIRFGDEPLLEHHRRVLAPGDATQLLSISPLSSARVSVRVDGFEWSSPVLIKPRNASRDNTKMFKLPETVELVASGNTKRTLNLVIDNHSIGAGGRSVRFFAPYWLVNETDLPLLYREVKLGLVLRTQVLAGRRGRGAHRLVSTRGDASEGPSNGNTHGSGLDGGPERCVPKTITSSTHATFTTLQSEGGEHTVRMSDWSDRGTTADAGENALLEYAILEDGVQGEQVLDQVVIEVDEAEDSDGYLSSQGRVEFWQAPRQTGQLRASTASVRNLVVGEAVGEEAELRSSSASHSHRTQRSSSITSRERLDSRGSVSLPVDGRGHAREQVSTFTAEMFTTPSMEVSAMELKDFVASGAECALFTYKSRDLFSNRLSVRVRDEGKWSHAFSLDVLDTPGCLRAGGRDIGVIVTAAPKEAVLSKVVIFAPRFVLTNTLTSCPIFYWETAAGESCKYIMPGEAVPFHRITSAGEPLVQIAVCKEGHLPDDIVSLLRLEHSPDPAGSKLHKSFGSVKQISSHIASGPFSVSEVGNVVVSCPVHDKHALAVEEMLMLVRVTTIRGTVEVIFVDALEAGYEPPYRIVNKCTKTIRVQQCAPLTRHRTVLPGEERPYVWEIPAGKDATKELSINFEDASFLAKGTTDMARVRLDRVTLDEPVLPHGQPPHQVWTAVALAGSTRVLTVWDSQPTSADWPEWLPDEEEDVAPPASIGSCTVTLALPGFGVSVVQSSQHELAYMSLGNVSLHMRSNVVREELDFSIGSLQVDNQLNIALLPVVLACNVRHQRHQPQLPNNFTMRRNSRASPGFLAEDPSRAFHFKSSRYLVKAASGPVFSQAEVLLNDLDVQLEEKFIKVVARFVDETTKGIHALKGGEGTSPPQLISPQQPADDDVAQTRDPIAIPPTAWYFEKLKLNPLNVNVTYLSSQRMIQELLRNPVHIPSIERLPLALNMLSFDELLAPPTDLSERIGAQYRQTLIRQLYKLVLNIDTLGQPANLVRNLGAGVKDFFFHPFGGPKTPIELGKDVVTGSIKLGRSALSGAFSVFAKVTGRAAGAVAHLSFDQKYLADRERKRGRAQQPQNVVDGVVRGTHSLGTGVVQGIAGLVVQPARGLREEGAIGFAKGVGKGLVGVAVKPTAGVLDLASRTAQGIANQANMSSSQLELQRFRPPRKLDGEYRTVKNYVHAEAAAHEILASFRAGKHKREKPKLCADLIPNPMTNNASLAILTERRLLLAHWVSRRVVLHASFDDIVEPRPSRPPDTDATHLVLVTRQRELWQHSSVGSSQQNCLTACMRCCAGPEANELAGHDGHLTVRVICANAKTREDLDRELDSALHSYVIQKTMMTSRSMSARSVMLTRSVHADAAQVERRDSSLDLAVSIGSASPERHPMGASPPGHQERSPISCWRARVPS